jgi:hypothetical protein
MNIPEQVSSTTQEHTFDTDLPDAVRYILGDGEFSPKEKLTALLGFTVCYRNLMGFTEKDLHEQ